MIARLLNRSGADVAFFHDFRPPPYGGSNQFLLALRGELERRGVAVDANRIGRTTRAALLNSWLVDERRIRRQQHEGCRVVHRLDGPLARYRGYDDGTDVRIVELNRRLAHITVFQSRYSLDAHAELGLDVVEPTVIPNAVDPSIFRPPAARPPREPVRVIATSWSDNPNKGASTLEMLDRVLDFNRFEVTFVGRSRARLEHVRTIGAVPSGELGDLLRAHHLYLAASRHDPASNALLEGLACGLPAVYHRSGGHAEIVGEAGVGFHDDDDVPAALADAAARLDELRSRISIPSLTDIADRYLDVMGLR